jgi:hypothetical protein
MLCRLGKLGGCDIRASLVRRQRTFVPVWQTVVVAKRVRSGGCALVGQSAPRDDEQTEYLDVAVGGFLDGD